MSEITRVSQSKAILGEGPIWYHDILYWVDIEGQKLLITSLDGAEKQIHLNEKIGTVVPRAKGGLVIALASGFAFLDLDTEMVTPIHDPEADRPDNRFNDGKCDPAGRFWAGTMSLESKPEQGSLYMLDASGYVQKKLSEVGTSNGICWNHDSTLMYYIDSKRKMVEVFDYDNSRGHIENRKTIIQFTEDAGTPDGMTIDSEGNLWIALWNGSAVVCYNTLGKQLHQIDVPAKKVTACAFGGEDLKTLYITTAQINESEDVLKQYPDTGALFKTKPGAKGVPSFAYQG